MAHYAFLDENNVVVEIISGIDETELIEGLDPETWYGNFRGQVCKRTSYNNNIRGRYATIGSTYDHEKDEFIRPQPFPLWILGEDNEWHAPVPRPSMDYVWDVETSSWVYQEKGIILENPETNTTFID